MITIRMSRAIFMKIVADLKRPHRFTVERVGWLFAKESSAGQDRIVLPIHYEAVPDDHYVEDEHVGARFGATAIRSAMQRARNGNHCCFQVHLHDHAGETDFSSVDEQTIDELAPAFAKMCPDRVHGGIVFTNDTARARVWAETGTLARSRVVIVGFPTKIGRLV